MNIELKSKIQNDKYTNYVYDTFDIQNREETIVSIPMNLDGLNSFDWNIGDGIAGYDELLLPIQRLRNDKMVNKEIFSRFFG
jgi:hypothetical protein